MAEFFKNVNINLFRWAYVLVFIIPLNFFIIGGGFGIGIQWVLIRYQETSAGTSLIPFTRSFEYVVFGTIAGRSAISEACFFTAVLLFIVSFILILSSLPDDHKHSGLLTITGGFLILISDILQSGLLLMGPGGTYIPVGIPFVLLLGYLIIGYASNGKIIPETVTENREHTPVSAVIDEKKICHSMPNGQSLGKIVYLALGVFIISLTLGMTIHILDNEQSGWDFRVYMGAAAAQADGQDPYNVTNINQYGGGQYHFAYPLFTLPLFRFIFFLTQFFHSLLVYYILLFLMFPVSGYLLAKSSSDPDYFLIIVLLGSAFASNYWIFQSGNFALVYQVFAALLFFFLIMKRFVPAAVVMGIFAAFSLFPVLFNGVFLGVRDTLRQRVVLILYSLGTSSALLLLSYCMNPAIFLSYIQALTGATSPVNEPAGRETPTLVLIIADIAKMATFQSALIADVAILVVIGILIGMTVSYVKTNRDNPVICYAFIFIAVFLMMPRIKPYYFAMLVVPLYFLLKDTSIQTKCIAVIIVSLFPLLCLYQSGFFFTIIPPFFSQYSQTVSLLVFMAFAFLNSDKKCMDEKT